MRRLAAGVAVGALVAACALVAPATRAEAAASWGCSKWVTTHAGFLGVTIYRGHLVCYGNIPKTRYRANITCTLGGEYWNRAYGAWRKQNSGLESRNSCPWPSRIETVKNITPEFK